MSVLLAQSILDQNQAPRASCIVGGRNRHDTDFVAVISSACERALLVRWRSVRLVHLPRRSAYDLRLAAADADTGTIVERAFRRSRHAQSFPGQGPFRKRGGGDAI